MTPSERLINSVEVHPVPPPTGDNPDNLPHVTHKGTLVLAPGASLDVVVLSTGQRLITQESLSRFIGGFADETTEIPHST